MESRKSKRSVLKISFAVVFSLATIVLMPVVASFLFSSGASDEFFLNSNKGTLAFYLEDDEENFVLQNTKKFPTDGYVLNVEKSVCL